MRTSASEISSSADGNSTVSTTFSAVSGDSGGMNFKLLYEERLNSFSKVWPYAKDAPCSPHKLAMAGLAFEGLEPSCRARCVVCHKILDNLGSHTDPWITHKELNPNCAFFSLGYPARPDGYTVEQFFNLMAAAVSNQLEDDYKSLDNTIRRTFDGLTESLLSDDDSF